MPVNMQPEEKQLYQHKIRHITLFTMNSNNAIPSTFDAANIMTASPASPFRELK